MTTLPPHLIKRRALLRSAGFTLIEVMVSLFILAVLAGADGRLQAHGVKIAVSTSDDRRATEAALRLLSLADLVDDIVCGDDPVPNKPSPEQLRHLARTMNVAVERMVMVGDSVTDMRTGRNAGVACCLGVLSGTGNRAGLADYAHHIADTLHAFEV